MNDRKFGLHYYQLDTAFKSNVQAVVLRGVGCMCICNHMNSYNKTVTEVTDREPFSIGKV